MATMMVIVGFDNRHKDYCLRVECSSWPGQGIWINESFPTYEAAVAAQKKLTKVLMDQLEKVGENPRNLRNLVYGNPGRA